MPKNKSGSALLFGTIVLFVILSVVISLSTVTVLETRMSQKTKSSTGAFFNADSGAEWALNKIASSSGSIVDNFGTPSGDSSYACPAGVDCKVYFLGETGILAGTATIAEIKAVRSVGTNYVGGTPDTTRAIEAAVAAGGIGKYQISCTVAGTSVWGCFRLDTETGTVEVKYTTGGTPAVWINLTNPW